MKSITVPMTQAGPALDEGEDRLLADAARNPAAFEALYERYLTRVYRYLYARLGNVAEAEDLTAQVFLAAYESLSRYRHRGQFAAWLFRIARCQVVDYYRAGETRRLAPLDETLAVRPDPLAALMAEEDLRRVRTLLARLNEDELELLRLRFAAGLDFESIARLLDRKLSAVKMAFYRLMDRLQAQMEVDDEAQ